MRDVNVRVLFFAGVKDAVGTEQVVLTLPEGASIAEMRGRLKGRFLRAAPHIDGSRLAVNQVFANDSDILSDGDEVAVIPPVSGG
jgi:molybdopterin synthase sulfur carrier subunit